ncbi:MAG: biopolymer transporter Tol, partial [bacterium]|nr:biopolymer transporter Tol [bacterium]
MTPYAISLFFNTRIFRIVLLLLSMVFVLAKVSTAQVTPFNHSGLKWRTMEGQFHVLHYHVGSERTAREILNIADAVHPQLVELYHYTPDTKVHWVVYDTDDYANGATYYLNNKIIIWAPALDFEFRGSHHWLRNVVTHEYAHMIQLGAARKWSREIPGIYTQVIDYEKESRPDVLYGFPNRIISYPVINTVVPHWFAEGTAQSMRKGMNFDYRDSHREMLLRTRSLTGNLLTLDEMGVFEKNSLGGELVYNQGFSLVQYISDRYGEASFRKLSEAMAKPMTWTLDGACRNALGVSARELYNDWSRTLKETYSQRTTTIRANEVNGRLLEEDGFGNLYPRWSNDGKNIYFVSNKEKDFFGGSKVVKYDVESGKKDKLFVTSAPFAIHPNDSAIVYSHQPLTKDQRRLNDLYWYNIQKKKSYRLTYEARVQQPDISSDGNSIVAITQSDGTSNLILIELPDLVMKDIPRKSPLPSRTLTNYTNGEQVSQPRFSPDGKSILFSLVTDENRDLIMLDVASGKTELLRESRWDDRNAAWSRDGKWIYFTSDSTGIWNVYRMSSDRTTIEPVTNVVGGALFGEPSPDGTELAFSRYE